MAYGRWLMAYGRWLMAYGLWPMAYGRWLMGLWWLEQTVDFACVDIDIDAAEAWIGTRARHQFDVASDWNDEACALIDKNVADGQGEAARAAFDGRIVGKTEVRLDHACAHLVAPHFGHVTKPAACNLK